MNAKRARDVLAALAECDPSGAYAGVQDAIASVAAGAPGADWPVSVRGGEKPAVRAGGREAPGGARFSAAALAEPVGSALKAFDGLSPIASVRHASRGRWTLFLARPLPRTLFLRADLSAAFVPFAAQLALVLRDAGVGALEFDGEALWARCE